MKLKLLLFFIMLIFSGLYAQTVVFESDFEIDQGWLIADLDLDGYNWGFSYENALTSERGFDGAVAFSSSYINEIGPLTPDNLLISPVILIPDAEEVSLSFKVGAIDTNDFHEKYSVYVVLNSEFTDATNLQEFINSKTPLLATTVEDYNATVKTLALGDYQNQDIRIIFRHHDSRDIYVIIINDIKVTAGRMGVNKATATKFSIFPNPAHDVINFSNAENVTVDKVTISDINGRLVKSEHIKAVSESRIDVSDLQPGIYFLTLSTNEGMITKKIIKK